MDAAGQGKARMTGKRVKVLEAVRCSEEEYGKACRSILLCECIDLYMPKLSLEDSARIDSLLRYHYLPALGYDLWRVKPVHRRASGAEEYVVEFGAEIKGSDIVGNHTAFIDSCFRPLGSIVGFRLRTDCCSHHAVTMEVWPEGEALPVLHIFRWGHEMVLPEEVGVYAPKDFVVEGYCYDFGGGVLYVKGYELVDGLHKGDFEYRKIRTDRL